MVETTTVRVRTSTRHELNALSAERGQRGGVGRLPPGTIERHRPRMPRYTGPLDMRRPASAYVNAVVQPTLPWSPRQRETTARGTLEKACAP